MTLLVKSLRQQILETIQAKIAAIEPPEPARDPVGGPYADPMNPNEPQNTDWPFKFSVVELGPLGPESQRYKYSVSIVPGPERHSDLYPYIVSNHQIGIEFRATHNKGDPSPQVMAEQVVTVLKRLVLLNRTWDGLAIDSKLLTTEVDLVNYSDRSIVGVLFIEVQYRHANRDPRDPDPNF